MSKLDIRRNVPECTCLTSKELITELTIHHGRLDLIFSNNETDVFGLLVYSRMARTSLGCLPSSRPNFESSFALTNIDMKTKSTGQALGFLFVSCSCLAHQLRDHSVPRYSRLDPEGVHRLCRYVGRPNADRLS